jgi:hypothetical protein
MDRISTLEGLEALAPLRNAIVRYASGVERVNRRCVAGLAAVDYSHWRWPEAAMERRLRPKRLVLAAKTSHPLLTRWGNGEDDVCLVPAKAAELTLALVFSPCGYIRLRLHLLCHDLPSFLLRRFFRETFTFLVSVYPHDFSSDFSLSGFALEGGDASKGSTAAQNLIK